MSIGALAKLTGLNVSAIRYYEEVGLIPQAHRRPSGHRAYSEEAQALLALIRRFRDFGFSIDETRDMVTLSMSETRDCAEARDIALRHLHSVRTKLNELQKLERSLAGYVQMCNDQCAGGPAPQCAIFKSLTETGQHAPPRPGCCR